MKKWKKLSKKITKNPMKTRWSKINLAQKKIEKNPNLSKCPKHNLRKKLLNSFLLRVIKTRL